MDYRRFGNKIVLRIDRGEEVVDTIVKLCEKENILCAAVSGLGAADSVTMGLYNVEEKKYHQHTFERPFEITALIGNITRMDGKVYQHLHITVADEDGHAFGGHLSAARISGTGEIVLDIVDGEVGRKVDDITGTGLNLFDF